MTAASREGLPPFGVDVEAIGYRPPAVRRRRSWTAGEIRIVHGEEARRVIGRTFPKLFSSPHVAGVVGTPRNVYYRVYKSGEGYAVFYLFEWDEQVFPPHKYDFEPVIVLTDRYGNPREVYVDGYHYFVKRYILPRGVRDFRLYTDVPWRAMSVRWGPIGRDEVELYPINEKEGRLGPPLRYLSDRVLEELRRRDENPLKIHPRLIRNPWSIREAEHWNTIRAPTPDEFLYEIAENYGLARLIKGPLTLRVVLALIRAKVWLENMVQRVASALSSLLSREEERRAPRRELAGQHA